MLGNPPSVIADSNADALFQFAEELFEDGEFYRAITEYRRLLSYFPDNPRAVDAHLRIFDCYFRGKRYLDAIDWSRRTQKTYLGKEVQSRTHFNLGKALFELENYPAARSHFEVVIYIHSDSTLVDQSRYWRGLCYLMESRWEEASEAFRAISPGSSLFERSTEATRKALDGKYLPNKKPWVVGLLALLPGVGYLYVGSTQTAFSALLVNGLFFWGTYSAFRKGETGVGTVLSLFTFGWYTGSIYGSVVGAYKYNLRVKQAFWRTFIP